jgi:hypothetical protein
MVGITIGVDDGAVSRSNPPVPPITAIAIAAYSRIAMTPRSAIFFVLLFLIKIMLCR